MRNYFETNFLNQVVGSGEKMWVDFFNDRNSAIKYNTKITIPMYYY